MSGSTPAHLAPSGKDPESQAEEPGRSWLLSIVNIFRCRPPSQMPQDPQSQIRKAESLLSGGIKSWVFSWVGKKAQPNEFNLEDAIDLYESAAIAFRNNNQAIEAGKAWERRAQLQTTYGKQLKQASFSLQEASKAYGKESPEDSVRCLQQAIQNHKSVGDYYGAAELSKRLGEQFRVEVRDYKRAVEAYQSAAEWYENEQKPLMADGCWEKVAELSAIAGDYYKAIEVYEKLVQNNLSGRYSSYKTTGRMLLAGLCHFASNDLVAASRAVDSYLNMDPNFATLREGQILSEIRYCVEAGDDARLEESLNRYRSLSGNSMPPWQFEIAMTTLENMRNQGEDFS